MSPHELELMLFINENILSPSIFDKVMKWALSATAEGYKFDAPSYSTLKKQNKWATHSPILLMDSGALKSTMFLQDEVGSDLPVTMWYFEQSFGVVCKVPLRSSSHEGLCLFSPDEIYWLWITCVWWDYISYLVMKHSAIHQWLKVECSWSGQGIYLLVLDTLMILQILTIWWRTQSILSYKLY